MKRIAVCVILLLLANSIYAQSRPARPLRQPSRESAAQAKGQQLPIRRVVLYSNGVAYFERRGTVTGRAEVALSFKQSQVDDVLKSMVVLDLGRGRIGAVSYNSSAPPSARLSEIPFSIEAATSGGADSGAAGGLAEVLRQLQGARVTVTAARRTATGAILTVEERKSQLDADKPPVTTQSLVIASEVGELASFDLADVRSVRLLDEGARKDIGEFAGASASARRRDAKTIVVTSDGEGQREMVVSYTVAAPIWKTTYRVVMDSAGKPFFQGWAIVDNVSDEDWNDVSLSLVSGTPVSFIQPIQQPLYRYRPVIPIPDDLKTDPQVHEEDIGPGRGYNMGGGSPALGSGTGGGVGSGSGSGVGPGSGAGAQQLSQQSALNSRNFANLAPGLTAPTTTLSDAITGADSGVTAAATGSEVGDLFQYQIDQTITVPRDRSALIPILQARLEGERVSVYNEATRRDRPMSGLRLKNTSQLTLEGGSLTVIDGDAYAGEALIERLKPGEQRFIPFAVDLATLVMARLTNEREPVFLVRTVNGVFQAHYHEAQKKTYTVTNQTDRPRVVYVEHPVRQGWVLSDGTPKPASKTASFYRFRLEVAARTSVDLVVAERRALMDTYAISDLTPRDVELFISRRYVDGEMRAALDKIIEIKTRIAAVQNRLDHAQQEATEISEDQERLRENIKALNDTAEARQLIARYVAKAGEQESRLEQIRSERKAAGEENARLQAELGSAVRALALHREME